MAPTYIPINYYQRFQLNETLVASDFWIIKNTVVLNWS